MDPKRLSELGLTETEARAYLTLLSSGRVKSGEIIRASGMQSSTVYGALSSLMSKGLVSFVQVGKVKHYSAEPPESFELFLDERKRRLESMMPHLKKMEAKSEREQKTARVFEGMKGLKTAYNDVYLTMKPGEDYVFYQVEAGELERKRISVFFRNWHRRRAGKGIKVRGLAVNSAKKPMKAVFEGLPHSKIRFVDGMLPTGMVVYKDKLLLLDLGDPPAAFLIQSKSIAGSFRGFFDEKWKTARE